MSNKLEVGTEVVVVSGYAPTFEDAYRVYLETGERGHQLERGTKAVIVSVDESGDKQPYQVLAENGMTQWLQENQLVPKGENKMAKKGDVVTVIGQDEMIEHFAKIGSEGVVIFEDYHPLFDGYHVVAFTDGQVFPNGQSFQAISQDLLEVTGSVSEEEVEALEILTGFADGE